MELNGKVAVVTGAASGIGRALVERFAREGMRVVLADIEPTALERAAFELAGAGAEVLPVMTDVSDRASVQALLDATVARFGTAHVVCNNAGVAGGGDPWRGPVSTWEWMIGVNLMGVVHGVQAFLPLLEAQGEGHIVNTASIAGVIPGILGAYSATKHAVVALSEGLFFDQQERHTGVGVSVLCPAFVRTQINEADRNWPARLGERPAPPVSSEEHLAFMRKQNAEGLPPARVADVVHDALVAGRFWIFPHPEAVSVAVQRALDMADGVDPVAIEPP